MNSKSNEELVVNNDYNYTGPVGFNIPTITFTLSKGMIHVDGYYSYSLVGIALSALDNSGLDVGTWMSNFKVDFDNDIVNKLKEIGY